jgi:plastocyanin
MRKSTFLMAMIMILALAVLLVGCSGATTPPASTGGGTAPSTGGATVVEKGFAFTPTSLTVKVGDTVTFSNEDSAPHVVKIDNAELGQQAPGASVTWKASKAGTFPYSCTIHPSMTGEVVVQ